ncbi:MAG: hypothetical protein QME63_01035 [Actinomycetota bacterium]|nr:hypothetical protein [Actinomycetota bacterium]
MKYKPRVKIICFILLLTFLLGVISAPLANAYNYQGLHWPGTSTYWAFDDYAPVPTSWQTPIISAATTWNNAGSRFRFIRDEALGGALGYTVRYYPWGQDGYIAMTVRS